MYPSPVESPHVLVAPGCQWERGDGVANTAFSGGWFILAYTL